MHLIEISQSVLSMIGKNIWPETPKTKIKFCVTNCGIHSSEDGLSYIYLQSDHLHKYEINISCCLFSFCLVTAVAVVTEMAFCNNSDMTMLVVVMVALNFRNGSDCVTVDTNFRQQEWPVTQSNSSDKFYLAAYFCQGNYGTNVESNCQPTRKCVNSIILMVTEMTPQIKTQDSHISWGHWWWIWKSMRFSWRY